MALNLGIIAASGIFNPISEESGGQWLNPGRDVNNQSVGGKLARQTPSVSFAPMVADLLR
jgi:hypothetical protein